MVHKVYKVYEVCLSCIIDYQSDLPTVGLDRGSMISASGLGFSHTKMVRTLASPNRGARRRTRRRTLGISLAAFLTVFGIDMIWCF